LNYYQVFVLLGNIMNILYHHRTQGKGVEGIHIRSIVKALRALGNNVTIISPPGCDPMQEEGTTKTASGSKSLKSALSFVSRNFPEAFFELIELFYNIPAFFKLNKEINKTKIDLIYERYFLFSIASIIISRKKSIPIIYEVNDSSFLPRQRQLIFIKIANFLERKVLSMADSLVTVTNHFKSQLVAAGIPRNKISVSHNAVDLDIFDPHNVKDVDVSSPPNRLIIGYVGFFGKWDALEKLIHHYAEVHSQFQETHLLLVGSGPEEPNLRKTITDLGLQSNVTITGTVPHKDIPFYIDKMDICIIFGHERYTSPVKLFEYMAMSKPVLAPSCEGIKEVIEHGKNGMLFEKDNEDHFLFVLKQMIENRDLLESLGATARIDVLGKYTWSKNVLRIENVFKLIKRKEEDHAVEIGKEQLG